MDLGLTNEKRMEVLETGQISLATKLREARVDWEEGQIALAKKLRAATVARGKLEDDIATLLADFEQRLARLEQKAGG